MNKILCSISTKGRYHTFLPLAIQSVINQTRQVDFLMIFDDNDEPKDLRSDPVYNQLFRVMDLKGIKWEWVFAGRKGQHHNHQAANERAARDNYNLVWRVDDDNSPEANVLANLENYIDANLTTGAVGGSVLTPEWSIAERSGSTGKIADIDTEANIQWGKVNSVKKVEHLHCSFLYRSGVYDYNLALSKVAHREETLFTYGMFLLGYELAVIPDTVTWHFKASTGGIRTTNNESLYAHDENIFRNTVKVKDSTVVILDSGMGDHIVFKHVLPYIKNPIVYSCYPQVIPGKSIQEAIDTFGDISPWNIYKKMHEWNWRDSLEKAYRKMYRVDK